jgi:hypothetical protein
MARITYMHMTMLIKTTAGPTVITTFISSLMLGSSLTILLRYRTENIGTVIMKMDAIINYQKVRLDANVKLNLS